MICRVFYPPKIYRCCQKFRSKTRPAGDGFVGFEIITFEINNKLIKFLATLTRKILNGTYGATIL